ncbi:polysaccharide pyruvyl transferase CsaB [Lentibacillus kapialis]|uniref:Polysaccharide pyruvyl transferase CsaB n=2 Tax=Lentibacillus kapialis TaxID=340214 RepID=A0A917Q0M7_9BACI|nr:polysaccharide pyruvyl transferase CsaB [Lentibacillus kapialis]
MLIGVVGNYGNENQGDEAILEGVLVQLEKTYAIQRDHVLVFTNKPEQTCRKYGVQAKPLYIKKKSAPGSLLATIRHHKSIIRKLDLLIIGGGGILMDLYINGLVIFGMYGWLAKRCHTPFVIHGAGAGPIKTPLGKRILKKLGNTAASVSVRDTASRELLASIGVIRPIQVMTDPAFQVPISQSALRKSTTPKKFGVTAVPYFHENYWPEENSGKYERYINGMAENLDNLLQKHTHIEITFFATKHPHDTNVTKDIQAVMNFPERTTIVEGALTHRDIIELIGEQDIVIGTRLHSLILALAVEKPSMAVSYHPKVRDFMEQIGFSEKSIFIENIHENGSFFLDAYRDMTQDWDDTQAQFKTASEKMKGQGGRITVPPTL